MQRTLVIAGVVAAAILLILANALYVVPVDQQAIVLRFGQAQYTVNATEAGMSDKGPMAEPRSGPASQDAAGRRRALLRQAQHGL